jgi:hypothetical protein
VPRGVRRAVDAGEPEPEAGVVAALGAAEPAVHDDHLLLDRRVGDVPDLAVADDGT